MFRYFKVTKVVILYNARRRRGGSEPGWIGVFQLSPGRIWGQESQWKSSWPKVNVIDWVNPLNSGPCGTQLTPRRLAGQPVTWDLDPYKAYKPNKRENLEN